MCVLDAETQIRGHFSSALTIDEVFAMIDNSINAVGQIPLVRRISYLIPQTVSNHAWFSRKIYGDLRCVTLSK